MRPKAIRPRARAAPLLLFAALLAAAQSPARAQRGAGGDDDGRLRVLIADVKQKEKAPRAGEIDNFIEDLIRLRLIELPYVSVGKAGDDSCGATERADAPTPTPTPAAGPDEGSYIICVSVDVRSLESPAMSQRREPSAEVVLSYKLLKTDRRGASRPLISRSEPVAEADVLRYVNSMADSLAARLAQEQLARSEPVNVYAVAGGGGEKGDAVRQGLTSGVVNGLNASGLYSARDLRKEPAANAAFDVSGMLTLGDRLSVRFTVTAEGAPPYLSPVVMGPPNGSKLDEAKLSAFYDEAANTLVAFLRNVQLARKEGLSGLLNAEQMLAKARELMCKPAGASESQCANPQPESAIPFLAELAKKSNDPEVFSLLGEARLLTQDYQGAGQSFDAAVRAASQRQGAKPQESARLVEASGDAWYRARDFREAAARFDELVSPKYAAALSPGERARAHRRRADTYSFTPEHLKALGALLDAFDAGAEPDDLSDAAGKIIDDLTADELGPALTQIESWPGRQRLPRTRELLLRRLGSQALSSALNIFGEGRRVEKYLPVIESPSISKLLNAEEVRQTQIVHGMWLLAEKRDTDGAVEWLERAKPAEPKEDDFAEVIRRVYLMLAYYKKLRLGTATRETNERLSGLLGEFLKGSVDASVYTLLVEADHGLGRDAATRELLESKATGENKGAALVGLSDLCLNYLADIGCGRKNASDAEAGGDSDEKQRAGLLLIEIDVIEGRYAEALKRFETWSPYVSRDDDPDNARFFRVWSQLATKNQESRAAAVQWAESLGKVREGDLGFVGTPWIFDAALAALDKEQQLSAADKKLLRDMWAAMRDPAAPLPEGLAKPPPAPAATR
jgi:hypothetical protein